MSLLQVQLLQLQLQLLQLNHYNCTNNDNNVVGARRQYYTWRPQAHDSYCIFKHLLGLYVSL